MSVYVRCRAYLRMPSSLGDCLNDCIKETANNLLAVFCRIQKADDSAFWSRFAEYQSRLQSLVGAALQRVFVDAFNQIYKEKDRLFADYGAIIEMLTDTATLDTECARLRNEA